MSKKRTSWPRACEPGTADAASLRAEFPESGAGLPPETEGEQIAPHSAPYDAEAGNERLFPAYYRDSEGETVIPLPEE